MKEASPGQVDTHVELVSVVTDVPFNVRLYCSMGESPIVVIVNGVQENANIVEFEAVELYVRVV